jgi:hypothetical protein
VCLNNCSFYKCFICYVTQQGFWILDSGELDVLPPFGKGTVDLTTAQVIKAILSGQCTLLKSKANYRTDRQANAGKPESTHTRGNSESEVSHPINIGDVCEATGIISPILCVNSLRMYGQISYENPLHFHGYANPSVNPCRMEFIIFSIEMITSYEPSTGNINGLLSSRDCDLRDLEGNQPVIFMFEEGGIIKHIFPEVGDMVVLPSGVFHEFSCLPGVFADLSSIEVASNVEILSGGSWQRNEGTSFNAVLLATVATETGVYPENELSLADIPSLKPYIETEKTRVDGRSLVIKT